MIFGVSRTSATKQMIFFSSVLWVVPFARRTRRQMAHVAPGEQEPIARLIEKNVQSSVDELKRSLSAAFYGSSPSLAAPGARWLTSPQVRRNQSPASLKKMFNPALTNSNRLGASSGMERV